MKELLTNPKMRAIVKGERRGARSIIMALDNESFYGKGLLGVALVDHFRQ